MSKVVRPETDGDKEEPPVGETAAPEDVDDLFAEAKRIDGLFQLFPWLRILP